MTSYSQHSEDVYLWNYIHKNNLETPNLIVELGACDGLESSNSRLFIDNGWNAHLVEANPDYYAKLFKLYSENAKVNTVNAAIISTQLDGGVVPFTIYPDHLNHSGIHKFPKFNPNVQIYINTTNYNSMPNNIGILSIDIEGLDTEIVIDMMLSKNLPEFVIVESNDMKERRDQIELLICEYDLINVLNVNTVWKRREQ